jgi:malonate transporter
LLILSTVLGSLAFFGIPFVTFAFGSEQSVRLATLTTASVGLVAITISILVLELYSLGEASKWESVRHIASRLSRNPLILSMVAGILVSIVGVELPSLMSNSLHMLGGTTSAVAIFMLGAFLYGKKYTNLGKAFGKSVGNNFLADFSLRNSDVV